MKSLRFVFSYTRYYIAPLVIATVSMIGLVGLQLITPWAVRELIAAVKGGPVDPTLMSLAGRMAFLLLGAYVVRAALRFASSYSAHIAGWGVVSDARQQIYEHLQRLSLRFYEDQQTGQLMSRMVNDSDRFEQLIAHAIPSVLVNVLMLVGVSVVLLRMSWQLMLLTMIPMPLIVLAMRSFAKYVRPAFRQRQKELADLNATLNDNLSGIREIKAFTREDREAARIGKHIERYRASLLNALRLMAIFEPFVEFASSLGTIVVIYFGGRLAFRQVLPIEDLVAFFLYLDMFYQPIRALSGTWEQIQEALAGADRIAEFIREVEKGPPLARVRRLEIEDLPAGLAYATFQIEGW